jgi:hypothetical protein
MLCRTIAHTVVTVRRTCERIDRLDAFLEEKKRNRNQDIERQNEKIEQIISKKTHLDEVLKYTRDEQSSLIRSLASLSNLSEQCMDIAKEEKLVHALLFIFPTPREELGEITPHSVTLTPTVPAPAILLGNAARCLLGLAEDERTAPMLYDKRGTSSLFTDFQITDIDDAALMSKKWNERNSGGGKEKELASQTPVSPSPSVSVPVCAIERLICAMATCSDIRVRRNISILLAKGCKRPGVRDQVDKFRGMQIMLELQKQL